MVITRQPCSVSVLRLSASRSILRLIFLCQYSSLLDGQTNLPQSCLCQKHPLTNITVLYLESTISGHPGSLRTFLRYRSPLEKRYLRTVSSGLELVLLIWDIFLLRTSFECVSAISVLDYIIVNRAFRKFDIRYPQLFASPALCTGHLVHGEYDFAWERTTELPVVR